MLFFYCRFPVFCSDRCAFNKVSTDNNSLWWRYSWCLQYIAITVGLPPISGPALKLEFGAG